MIPQSDTPKAAEEWVRWMVIQLEADGILPDGTSLEKLLRELLSLRLSLQRLEAENKELREEVGRMRTGFATDASLLREAVETIHVFHGTPGWSIYATQSPEMKRLNARLRELESQKGKER